MIIDFHTHIFPDALAPKTIPYLAGLSGITPSMDGTRDGLLSSMKEAGIDYSVVLPVVTQPKQFASINRFAAQINGHDGILSFGGIHPDSAQPEQELEQIADYGLKGIKLHPDYQAVCADDPRYIRIVSEALRRRLIIVFHAGVDIGLPEPNYSTPQMLRHLLDELSTSLKELPNGTTAPIVLAHTGGFRFWDEVEQLLVGQPVYFDLSFSAPYLSDEQMLRIIRAHGAHRILFGTDCPWGSQKGYLEHLLSLPFTEEEKEQIFWKNAAQLLQLS